MATNTSYSIDTILAELIQLSQNSLEIITSLSNATTTQDSEVIISIVNSDGTTSSFSYPSLGHLKNEVSRIDTEIQRILGITNEGSVSVRLADGSYSTVFLEKFATEPATMLALPIPTTFSKKNNWFFEQFLNPLLYVTFDVQNLVDDKSEKALYKRLILNLDTQEKLDYFNTSLLYKNTLDYNTTLTNLSANGISYFVDEDIAQLPVSIVRYVGSFDVYNIVDEPTNQTINGSQVTTSIRKYYINKLSYTDNNEPVKDNKFLQIGDILICNEDTKYQITDISNSDNYVVLKRIAGYSAINIGANQLTINPGRYSSKNVNINVGFDEYQIIWVRGVNPDSNIAATEWGNGVGIYTNNLTISTASGNVTLKDFYLNEVSDFGKVFLSAAKENPIPAIDGLKPSAPLLNAQNFSILRTNAHKDESQEIDDIKAKQAERLKVKSEIDKLNTSIINKTKELNTTKFSSDAQQLAVKTELTNLIQEKSSKSTYYASLITDLVAKGKELGGGLANPTYAIRGFFPIPDPLTGSTGKQQVIGFITQFRKLRNDGTASNAQQQQFVNNNGSLQNAVYSDWIEYKGPVLTKAYNENTGAYTWITADPASSEAININQIDIPISSNEQVEFRIRSVSEAGYPTNPILSDWSESIIVPFDNSLPVGNETAFIITDANTEDILLSFQKELTDINQHISDSFNNGDKYYAHTLDDLASGFFDSSNQIISAFKKIKEHDDAINALNQTLTASAAGLQVSLVDPATGNTIIVNNGQTIQLDAGYYADQVDITNPSNWGNILTKIWNINVQNISTSPLELVSIFNSDVVMPLLEVPDLQAARYQNVPLSIGNIKEGSESYFTTITGESYPFINPVGYQSAQIVNQWIYTRQRNLNGTELYDNSVSNVSLPVVDSIVDGSTNFVKFDPANFTDPNNVPSTWITQQLSKFTLSNEFTYADLYDFWNTIYQYQNQTNIIGNNINLNKSYPAEIISNARNASNSLLNGFKKIVLPNTAQLGTPFNYVNFSPMKNSFFANDKFLVGKDTCLDYLFLAPDSYQTIQVPGTFSFSSKIVNNGSGNSINIPLVYQFRMIDRNSTILGGSDLTTSARNLNWQKTLGIDIFYKDSGKIQVFSFDVNITSNYRKIKQI